MQQLFGAVSQSVSGSTVYNVPPAALLQMCCPHHVIVSYLAARQERMQWGSQSQGQAGVEVSARESEVNTPASIPALRSADCTGLAATGIQSDRFRHNTQYAARTTFHY